jgi:hypothetical protein
VFEETITNIEEYSRNIVEKRLADHDAFVEQRLSDGKEFQYRADKYDIPVTTKQETRIQFYAASDVRETAEGYRISHEPIEGR